MQREQIVTGAGACTVYRQENPEYLFLQPVDDHDLELMDQEVETIAGQADRPFLLAALRITDWNRQLSPWEAPPVFGKEGFGHGAPETLVQIEDNLLPALQQRYNLVENIPVVLGGYSLAGLFSLWSACQSSRFSAIAAASPSVWFPGWAQYAASHLPHAQAVYLSLGDREERTRNAVMATVGQNIRELSASWQEQGVCQILEWNPGNHFRDPDSRVARGFLWCMRQHETTC